MAPTLGCVSQSLAYCAALGAAHRRTGLVARCSASNSSSGTRWVLVVSEAGQELDLDHGIAGPVRITDHHGRTLPARQVGPTRVRLGTRRGQTVVVRPAGSPLPDRGPVDVRATGTAAPWGLP